MKQNIEFYPHYAASDQHAKFKMLRVEFGWAGEGKFWALNNRIAQADGCCLDVSKKYNKAALASDLDFSLEDFDKFILFLKDDCELISECEKGIITTEIITETFDKVMKDRSEARGRYRRASTEKKKTSHEKTHRVKESKGKERKKETIEYPNWLDLDLWQTFIIHRNGMKPKLSPHAQMLNINKLKNLIDKGYDQTEIINQTIERGWKGLFEPKEDFNKNNNPYELKFND